MLSRRVVSGFACRGILVLVLFIAMPSLTAQLPEEEEQNKVGYDFLYKYGLKLLAAVNEYGNVIVSPVRFHLDLGLVYSSAAGQTKEELRKHLRLAPNEDLSTFLQDHKPLFNPRTSIQVLDTPRKDKFIDNAKQFFGAEITPVSNESPAKASYGPNDWEGSLKTTDQRQCPFNSRVTKTFPFHVSKNITKHIPMTRRYNSFPYSEDKGLNARILKLSLMNQRIAAYFIVPKRIGLEELKVVEEKLMKVSIASKLRALTKHRVSINIPKCSSKYFRNLENTLQGMGLKGMFSKGAIFSNMTDWKVYRRNVLENILSVVEEDKSFGDTRIEFDPIYAIPDSRPPRYKQFWADRPFLLLFTTDPGLMPLLMARIVDPVWTKQ